ncbi:hypothetical protein MKW98_003657 [Papaver atlanticum]|uniref:Uncharacterized protein n=1 Tax=Papaver atlanticum TaxID=357466 RepID=A0AAD4SIS8_9MAGN|nr:hypothetical protein MKW98_003657 [Papaver atlanticum]
MNEPTIFEFLSIRKENKELVIRRSLSFMDTYFILHSCPYAEIQMRDIESKGKTQQLLGFEMRIICMNRAWVGSWRNY